MCYGYTEIAEVNVQTKVVCAFTYISDYYGKDDSGTMAFINEALKKAENESLRNRLSIVANTFLTHRQIGESEAYFKILPHLEMKHSNIESLFIPTGFKANRSKFLKQITEEESKHCSNLVQVDNRDGYFTEAPSMLDKYERRNLIYNPYLAQLSYIQFCMRYSSTNMDPTDDELRSSFLYSPVKNTHLCAELDLIITDNFEVCDEHYTLPTFIGLTDVRPGEPRFMKKRKRRVIRIHKFSSIKTPHEHCYAELQLYRPFKNESDLHPDNYELCDQTFNEKSVHNDRKKIDNVKSILMPNLESVEIGTERAIEMLNADVGDALDPVLEQDNYDCVDIGSNRAF